MPEIRVAGMKPAPPSNPLSSHRQPSPPMLWFLRLLFVAVFAAMLSVTTWASFQQSIFAIP